MPVLSREVLKETVKLHQRLSFHQKQADRDRLADPGIHDRISLPPHRMDHPGGLGFIRSQRGPSRQLDRRVGHQRQHPRGHHEAVDQQHRPGQSRQPIKHFPT